MRKTISADGYDNCYFDFVVGWVTTKRSRKISREKLTGFDIIHAFYCRMAAIGLAGNFENGGPKNPPHSSEKSVAKKTKKILLRGGVCMTIPEEGTRLMFSKSMRNRTDGLVVKGFRKRDSCNHCAIVEIVGV